MTRRQIRAALELVGKRDLFDALGLGRDAAISEVARRADDERQRWMRKSQVTAEKTAWLEVISYAQSHLAQPEGRSKYEKTLIREAEDSYREIIAFALEGVSNLDPGSRHVLLDEAAAYGIIPDRAERILTLACRTAGISRDGGGLASFSLDEAPPRYIRCRSCTGLTEFSRVAKQLDAAVCRHCRATLRWECPTCRRAHWADESRCSCGFEVCNLESLVKHFEAAQHAHKVRDYDAALEHLGRVQEYAPRHVGARKAVEKVKERLAEVEAAKGEFELARSRKHLLAARQALLTWASLVDPTSQGIRAAQGDLLGALREAQDLIAQGRNAESRDPRAARSFYRRALEVAVDLQDAREGLKRCPPDPPTNATATVGTNGVSVRWSPPSADGIGPCTFRVVRKVGGTPDQVKDGTAIKDLDLTEFTDTNVPTGQSVGYAIFSVRNGVVSQTGATVAPQAVVLEVDDLRADGSSGEITLSWTLPRGAKGAKVARLGMPGVPETTIDSLSDHAVDRGLDDKRIYRYRIHAIFTSSDGKTILSPGIEIAATPAPPAAPAGPLSIVPEIDGRVTIHWPAVPRGSVKILRTTHPLPHPAGARLTATEVNKIEGIWLDSMRSDATTDPEPPAIGLCHYTPFVFLNGTATIGTAAGFSSVPDPTDLRAVRVGSAGKVHLRWRWTPRATETIVVARAGSAPIRADDPDAIAATVSEGQYSHQGYYTLNLPVESQPGPWHLAVFSVASVDGVKITSPGLESTARTIVPGPNPEITVSYTLRRPTFPGRPWAITIATDPPGATVPPLALVSHPRTMPLAPDDGQIIERFPACKDGATFSIKPLVDLGRKPVRLFADPGADPSGQAPIRLKHPESVETRV